MMNFSRAGLTALLVFGGLAIPPPARAQIATITVYPAGAVPISPLLYGVNYVWDKIPAGEFAAYQARMDNTAHASLSRYLGGWGAESYDWSANSEGGKRATPDPGEAPDGFLAAVPAASFVVPSADAIADPSQVSADVALAVDLVGRYGRQVRYWEIGNEWWLQRGAKENPDKRASNLRNYAGLLAGIVPAMKAANPSIQIFATGDWTQPGDFASLREMTGAAWTQVDGVSVHTYCGASDPVRQCTALPAAIAQVRAAAGKQLVYASEWAATKSRNPNDFGIRNANLTVLALQDMVFAGIGLGAYWPPVKIVPALAFASPDYQTAYATGTAFGWMSQYYEGTALRTAGDLPSLAARDGGVVNVIIPSGDTPAQAVRLNLNGLGLHRIVAAEVLYSEQPDDPEGALPAVVATLPATISTTGDNTIVQFEINPGGAGRGQRFEIARLTLQ